MASFINVQGVERQYTIGSEKVRALDGIDLQIAEGEFVALLGSSGSGKSTLLHLLGALDQPSAGKLSVAGTELTGITQRDSVQFRRTVVGFVFQSFHLVPSMTATGNVELALTLQSVYGSDRNAKAKDALLHVGLAARSRHRPTQLSGGEQQRVAIARAIANRPKILLADEPTGNLDRRNGTEILDLFRKFQEDNGCTIVMATHDEEFAVKYADRVIRLRDGKVVHA